MIKRLLWLIIVGAICAYFVRGYGIERVFLASNSMSPTLPQGRHVLVNKMVYQLSSPRRGDIVMLISPMDGKRGLIKRVIAVGGDTIEIRAKKVYVNEQLLAEPYAEFQSPDDIFQGDNLPPTHVPENHVFLLGDNRDVSGDSRDWKDAAGQPIPFVPYDKIQGRIILPNS